MVPDIAILDPALPATCPAWVTASSGIDVLTHALEAFVSTAATSFTDPYAQEAIRLVFDHLETAWREPDNMRARCHMHNASALAGVAFTNASLGIVHSLAHKIGGEFGVTHGLANGILLPYVIRYNSQNTDKYRQVEKQLGIASLTAAILELNARIDIPATFSDCHEVDFPEDKFNRVLDRMSANALADPCTLTNPRQPSVADMRQLYCEAWYG
ncbi:hypothetical protein [Affinibrenneria salicis]